MDRLEQKYSGKVAFLRVDADKQDNKDLMVQYKVRAIPLFEFFDSKGNHVDSKLGTMDESEFEGYIGKISK
ncbi:MAG: thioredoxin domain-containing protein [Firmicutes bacterium]|nr:thioredoxin domain-containing protein [Bacillota bacterium]